MKKARKIIIEKPLLSTLILTLIIQIIFHFDTWFLKMDFFETLFNIPEVLDGTCNRIITTAFCLLFLIYCLKGNLNNIGFHFKNTRRAFKISFFLVLLCILLNGLSVIPNIIRHTGHFPQTMEEIGNAFGIIVSCFFVGLVEEVAYRCVLINTLRNKQILDERKQMFYCVILSSILFGLIHLTNIISGDPVATGIATAINAAGFGMIFGALYWSSGSIIPSITLHFIWDTLTNNAYFYIIEQASTSSAAQNPALQIGLSIVTAVIYTLIAMYILRKKKDEGCKIELQTLASQNEIALL